MTILKAIVACLALANVAYYLWAREIAHPDGARALVADGATLKLAAEAPGSGAAASSGSGAESFAGGVTGTDGGDATAAIGADTNGGSAAGGVRGALGSGVSGASAAAGAERGGLLTSIKRCITVGPFRDVAEAARAASTLRGGGYDPRQRMAEGEVWSGVWVYLPISPGRTAEQMLSGLKAGGIDDALEMPGPNDGPVISLGLYNDSKRAQSRIAQAQSLGFNPGIADRKRNGDVYWIDLDLKPTDSVLKPSDLQAGESGRIVRLEVKGCPAGGGAS